MLALPARAAETCQPMVYTYAVAGDITEESAHLFVGWLNRAKRDGATSVRVDISSPGGDATAALDMTRALRASGMTSVCTVRGMAASGAALLLQGCGTRLAVSGSKLIFHRPYGRIWAPMPMKLTPEMARKQADELDRIANETDGQIAQRMGMSMPAYRQKVANGADWEMTASEAMAHNAIDRVVEP